ncbi:MAG: hypothetical protein WD872_14640 [Pirellulaceae bacterium]
MPIQTQHQAQARRRRGLTLTELLIAGTIMTLIVGGMGTLVNTVHSTNDFCRGQAVAAQHARVAMDRIQRAVRSAAANEQFPGCVVVADEDGSWNFPDTLVVWSPTAAAPDTDNVPQVNELLIFCSDATNPNVLIELRAPGNTNPAPAAADQAGWQALVDGLKLSTSSDKVELSDRLRTASVSDGAGGTLRGCVRFHLLIAPSLAEWDDNGLTWNQLSWPLDFYSTQTGMRRVVCQYELQLLPGDSDASQTALPFFGSAALTYNLSKKLR